MRWILRRRSCRSSKWGLRTWESLAAHSSLQGYAKMKKASKISRKIVIYIFTLYQAVMLSMTSVRAGASSVLSYSGAAPCCAFGYCTEWRLRMSCPTALLCVVLPSFCKSTSGCRICLHTRTLYAGRNVEWLVCDLTARRHLLMCP